jgi:polyphosphate kinase 2 (PPK2 family)
MLERVDLSKQLSPEAWDELRRPLQERLAALQQAAYRAEIPTIVLFEGWQGAGQGASLALLARCLDPRGYRVWPITASRSFEKNYPWLWRFWLKLPGRGEIALFDGSWYGRVLAERVEGAIAEPEWHRAYRDITDFEQTLAEDGYVIVKLWLHIHRRHDDYLVAAEEMLERTDTSWGAWTVVEATDTNYMLWRVLAAIADALEGALIAREITESWKPEAGS